MAIKPYVCVRTNQAAGAFLFAIDTGRCLLGLRSQTVDCPGVWGQFGGGIEKGETPEMAIRRELFEEAGYNDPIYLRPLRVNKTKDFSYHNYVGVIEREFVPVLNDETETYVWCDFGKWPSPMHPGCLELFNDRSAMILMKSIALGKSQ